MATIVIQALPASGKTSLASTLTVEGYDVIDTDVLWYNLNGADAVFEDMLRNLRDHSSGNVVIFTNCWIHDKIEHDEYLMFYPEWNSWLETILDSRLDLVHSFGFDTLRSWYLTYVTEPDAVQMKKGEYLSDTINLDDIVNAHGIIHNP